MSAKPRQIYHPNWQQPLFVLGNSDILNRSLTGFLSSQTFPAKAVLPIYKWARTARSNGECIISGFHAPLERDVQGILITGRQPLVWVVARSLPKRPPPPIKEALEAEKLLIISPHKQTQKRPDKKSALIRNQCIIAIADKIVVGYATANGNLHQLITAIPTIEYIIPPEQGKKQKIQGQYNP